MAQETTELSRVSAVNVVAAAAGMEREEKDASLHSAKHVLRICGWNMRTLVGDEGGDVRTSRRGRKSVKDQLSVPRKAELTVEEFRSRGISIADISETPLLIGWSQF